MIKYDTNFRETLTPRVKLLVTLRYSWLFMVCISNILAEHFCAEVFCARDEIQIAIA